MVKVSLVKVVSVFAYDDVRMLYGLLLAKTAEIDAHRFKDRDLRVAGVLEYGQFGVVSGVRCSRRMFPGRLTTRWQISVVNCRLNGRLYVRKSTDKQFALRARDVRTPLPLL